MRHPFDGIIGNGHENEGVQTRREAVRTIAGAAVGIGAVGVGAEAMGQGVTTLAVGEEGGKAPSPRATTKAVGEEGGIVHPKVTSKAVGEEGGKPVRPKWVKIFDGKTLKGWTDGAGKPVKAGWVVAKDGSLHRSSKGGSIYTKKEYGDFILRIEWKVSPGANSGIKYRVKEYQQGKRKSLLGPEYQILDDTANKESKIENRSASAMYALFAPNRKYKKLVKVGEWNRTEILAQGSRLNHMLNGRLVVSVDTKSKKFLDAVAKSKFKNVKGFAQNAKGRIMLQDHGDEVWYRNIQIMELPNPNRPVPTTAAVGEEGGTTKAVGEEGGRIPRPRTRRVGEAGGPRRPGIRATTLAVGEEGAGSRKRTTQSLKETGQGGTP